MDAAPFAQIFARVEPEIKDALEKVKETDGIMIEYQVRMGALMWLESRGITPLKKKRA